MDRKPSVRVFENSFILANHLYKTWIDLATDSIHRTGRFTVALSGGKTPIEFYCKLSSFDDYAAWQNTQVFIADERFVPANDKASNLRLIQETLLNYVPIPGDNIHPVSTNINNAILAAEHYKEELVRHLPLSTNGMPSLDLIILGIGEDGHTASIFPHADGSVLTEQDDVLDPQRLTVPVSHNFLKNERISMTLPLINNAHHIIVQVQGRRKAEIIKRILAGDKSLPASWIQPQHGQLYFYLDAEAARHLDKDIDFSLEDYARLAEN